MKLSTRSALAWSFAERHASFVVTLASTLVLARLLTPAQVGVYSLCAALLAVAAIVRDFGVSEYLIQAQELGRERLQAAFGVALAAAWLLAGLIWLSRHAVAAWFGEPMVAQVLSVMVMHFLLLPLSSPAFALLNRDMAFRRIFWLQTANNSVGATVAVVLAMRGHGTLALAWGPLAGVLTQTLLIAWLAPRSSFVLPSPQAALRHGREVLSYGLAYMGSRLIETLAKNVHEPVIAKSFNFEAVGLFSRAYGLVEMFHSHVADAVVRVSTPMFAEAHRAGQPVGLALARATALYTSISWPFFGFVALCAPEIISLLFGHQWLAAAPLASTLALAALPAALYELVPQLLSATGHVRRRLRLAAWVAPVHIVGVILAAQHSLQAVAAVGLLSSTVMLLLCRAQLQAALGLGWKALVLPSLGSAVLALFSVSAVAATVIMLRDAEMSVPGRLLLAAATGFLAWLLAGWVLRHPIIGELGSAIRTLRLKTFGSTGNGAS